MSTIERLIEKVDAKRQARQTPPGPGVADQPRPPEAEPAHAPQAAKTTDALQEAEVQAEPAKPSLQPPPARKTIRIDFDRLSEWGIYPPEGSTEQFRGEFLRIKRPILSNAFGKSASLVDRGNLIMVTSSVPGEGKTFTAINLALSIASERDHTVLLVDADVAKSDLTRLFGLGNEPGLSDLLLHTEMDIGEVLVHTDIPKLKILPSGAYHPEMTELMASKRMTRLVNELGERYADRAVIFDSPPVLATSEAQLLAELAGQLAYVIQAGRTPQDVVQEAIASLAKGRAIGLILNRTQNLLGSGYQSGYYGYSGYGSQDEDREPST